MMKHPFFYIAQTMVLTTVCLAESFPKPLVIDSGWQLQSAAEVSQSGQQIARTGFHPDGWYLATVPGTVLTTLVNNKVYPEPLYGENNRPDSRPITGVAKEVQIT